MTKSYPIPENIQQNAHISTEQYEEMYQHSISNPESFWDEQGKIVEWMSPYSKVRDVNLHPDDLRIKWYEDGTLNASANCLDRHLAEHGENVAIQWVGDNPAEEQTITYRELHRDVCKFANGLKSVGVNKGDRVTIYMPMIPEAAVAMLACARIGAIHSVVFGGFSAEALAGRITDCDSKVLITANEGFRGGKTIPIKQNADKAAAAAGIKTMVVVKRTETAVNWQEGRDHWYHDLMAEASEDCPPEEMGAEDPLFILYTSGSTGKPKGVMHTTGGYMVYATLTFKTIFDYKPGELYWCTADVGWITGHTYLVYGPLSNGAKILMFEGVPSYPDYSRFWSIVEKYQVNIFYTAPTAIRDLRRHGDEPVLKHNRDSLRIMGSVGEPIDPDSWEWYHNVVGNGNCPVVDTWWQTETGGIVLTTLPGAMPMKPGSTGKPFFGAEPMLVDNQGQELEGAVRGNLVLKKTGPGLMRGVFRDPERFKDTYFAERPGVFYTFDRAERDEDGYHWITGRTDDVINVAGHRIGTVDIESALTAHPAVAENAAVGFPHDIKGQGIYVYVCLNDGQEPSEDLRADLVKWAREKNGPVVTPDYIQWVKGLPKTRSGKVMRRILRKVAANDFENLGDTSTLADPSVVDNIIENRLNRA